MASSSDELVAALATGKHVLAEPRNGVHVDALAYVDNQAEYARVAAAQQAATGGSQAPSTTAAISTSHYNAAILPEDDGDVAAWQAAVDKARVRLEVQTTQAVNLELLGKYGTAAWKGHAQQLEGIAAHTQAALKRLEKSSNDVNAARRSTQSQKGTLLAGSAGEWTRAMDSSFQLKVAIAELQGKVDTMRGMVAAKGGGAAHTASAAGADADGDVQLS